eukprot:PhM_4_TR11388/c1_g1_i1/m.31364
MRYICKRCNRVNVCMCAAGGRVKSEIGGAFFFVAKFSNFKLMVEFCFQSCDLVLQFGARFELLTLDVVVLSLLQGSQLCFNLVAGPPLRILQFLGCIVVAFMFHRLFLFLGRGWRRRRRRRCERTARKEGLEFGVFEWRGGTRFLRGINVSGLVIDDDGLRYPRRFLFFAPRPIIVIIILVIVTVIAFGGVSTKRLQHHACPLNVSTQRLVRPFEDLSLAELALGNPPRQTQGSHVRRCPRVLLHGDGLLLNCNVTREGLALSFELLQVGTSLRGVTVQPLLLIGQFLDLISLGLRVLEGTIRHSHLLRGLELRQLSGGVAGLSGQHFDSCGAGLHLRM